MSPKRKPQRRPQNKKKFNRITCIATVIFILGGIIALRLFCLQVLYHQSYKASASSLQDLIQEILPKRGNIFVKEEKNNNKLRPIATNKDLFLIYAIPGQVKDSEETAEQLAAILDVPAETLLARLDKKDDPYEPIQHFVSEEKLNEVQALNIEGIESVLEPARYYPDANLFSHVSGFIGYKGDDRLGQYGLEEYFEETLYGEKGIVKAKKDPEGRLIHVSNVIKKEPKDGADLILTIDYPIQFTACSELKNAVEKYDAQHGSVIVMDPKTGKILAMCNYPDYDPNNYNEVEDINLFINKATSYSYEPGSIFKAFTMAAAMDSGKVNPQTTYEDTGSVVIGKYTIKNSDLQSHGEQNMIQVLEKSLNTGAVFAAMEAGKDVFKDYVEKFGFGELTEIELPGEIKGDISSLDKKGDIYTATASFGQGITVTPIQLITAFSVIANQGKLMKPYLVDEIVYSDGSKEKTEPRVIREVLKPETAATLSAMLASVVENGYGNKAGVGGYYIAGKTGTAEVAEAGGYGSRTIHSFGGFGPINDPKFTILVKLDSPTAVRFAADSAAPVFKKIAEFILGYYGVLPER